ncbi:MAG: PEP-CTERM sorting domain-containing protein [Burkholderiaceae bacterium]|nr:PEP-CTERM sorting domain-containing protein [Burkholderiaceae bacterium]
MSGRNRKLAVAAAAAVALGVAAHGANASVVWGGSEYDVVTAEGITWSVAKAAADATGWHLATVTSAAEDAFVSSLLPSSPASRSHFWLGASDAANEGSWQWVTGEAWSYMHWWSGEPNNVGAENYLAYDYRGGWAWNDAQNDLQSAYPFVRGYVIERATPAVVPLPGTLALLGIGIAAAVGAARRRPSR